MAYPFIGTSYHGGTQKTVSRIVIHGTVSPTVKGGARAVARYFQSPKTGGSAHYVVDPGEIVQCVKEGTVAYHAPPNTGSIGIELCDPQKGSAARWGDSGHEAMLKLAARLTREIAARHGIPLKRLSVADLKAGRKGICGHVDVSNAFRKTDHSDPGTGFPWAHFMDLVTGTSAPQPQQEDTLQPVVDLGMRKPHVIPAHSRGSIPFEVEYQDATKIHADATRASRYPSIMPKGGDAPYSATIMLKLADQPEPGKVAVSVAAYERTTNDHVRDIRVDDVLSARHLTTTLVRMSDKYKYRADILNESGEPVTVEEAYLQIAH